MKIITTQTIRPEARILKSYNLLWCVIIMKAFAATMTLLSSSCAICINETGLFPINLTRASDGGIEAKLHALVL